MITLHRPAFPRRKQRGATLVEALLAFVFLSIATIAATQAHSHLRLHADIARQRTEAVRLGERELESLRAWSSVAAASGASAYDSIVDADSFIDAASGFTSNTAYHAARRVDAAAFAGAKSTSVALEWIDRSGSTQRITLDSVIARSDPRWSGGLALGAGAGSTRGAFGRSPAIPVTARSLGTGQSIWKPLDSGTIAVVFDDASGAVVGRCAGVAADRATRDLGSSDLADCTGGAWMLLSGTVRFNFAVPPLAAQANDSPAEVAVALALSGGSYAALPECSAEPMKTVRYRSGGSLHVDAVAIAAEPAALGLASWSDTGERFVSYRCLVAPRADGRWSGRATLMPSGWTIGTGSGDRRVCRYASDRDGSGAIDANIEHPAEYVDVAGALAAQNFLVVRGDQACPGVPDGGMLSAGLGTVQHQP